MAHLEKIFSKSTAWAHEQKRSMEFTNDRFEVGGWVSSPVLVLLVVFVVVVYYSYYYYHYTNYYQYTHYYYTHYQLTVATPITAFGGGHS